MSRLTYHVPDISCNHCKHAIESGVSRVQGVESVEVDVQARTVTVSGDSLDEAAIVGAIDEAGYEVASA